MTLIPTSKNGDRYQDNRCVDKEGKSLDENLNKCLLSNVHKYYSKLFNQS